MNDQELENDRLIEEALDLIIRVHEDPDNPVTRELVARWSARSSQHEAAWHEVMEIHGMASLVIQKKRHPQQSDTVISRRRLLKAGAGGLTVLAAGAVFAPSLILQARADYQTGTGELRSVQLSDGIVMMLGPESAVALHDNHGQQQLELLSGMAYFDVVAAQNHPFTVEIGGFRARTFDASFDIGRHADFITSSVVRGNVELQAVNSWTLKSGDWLSANIDGQRYERGHREHEQTASWRDGLLIVERETIASVVARIARWHSSKIVIAQSAFGQNLVNGSYNLHTPLAALEAVVEPYGGKVRQISPFLTVISAF